MANKEYKKYLHDKYVTNNAGSQSAKSSGSAAYNGTAAPAQQQATQRKPLLQEMDEKFGVKRDPSA